MILSAAGDICYRYTVCRSAAKDSIKCVVPSGCCCFCCFTVLIFL